MIAYLQLSKTTQVSRETSSNPNLSTVAQINHIAKGGRNEKVDGIVDGHFFGIGP